MRAVDECQEDGIFAEVLTRYKEKILGMGFIEFDEDAFVEMIREEERENTAREKARADQAEARIAELVNQGYSPCGNCHPH